MRVLLVRHGETPGNVIQSLDTRAPGPALTARGYRQALAVPHVLQGLPVDGIWASTLVRTVVTAAPLSADRQLTVHSLEGFREVRAGILEGRTDADSHAHYHDVLTRWLHGELDAAVPEGESGAEFLSRYDSALERVAESGVSTAVVVSHGSAIRHWAGLRVTGVSTPFALTHILANTGMVEIEGEPGSWTLVSWRDHAADEGIGAETPA